MTTLSGLFTAFSRAWSSAVVRLQQGLLTTACVISTAGRSRPEWSADGLSDAHRYAPDLLTADLGPDWFARRCCSTAITTPTRPIRRHVRRRTVDVRTSPPDRPDAHRDRRRHLAERSTDRHAIATWNVNSIRARSGDRGGVDGTPATSTLAMQETKCPDDQFRR